MEHGETFRTFLPYSNSRGRQPAPAAVRLNGGTLRFNKLASQSLSDFFGDTEVALRIGSAGTVLMVPSEGTGYRGRKLTMNKRTGVVSLSVRGLYTEIKEGSYPVFEIEEKQGFKFMGVLTP